MHKRYLVTGTRQYRWHQPGAVFEALLDPDAERRAIERGSIRVLAVVDPSIKPGSFKLPNNPPIAADELNRGALSGSRTH